MDASGGNGGLKAGEEGIAARQLEILLETAVCHRRQLKVEVP